LTSVKKRKKLAKGENSGRATCDPGMTAGAIKKRATAKVMHIDVFNEEADAR